MKESLNNIKISRLQDEPELKKQILVYLFDKIINKPLDVWYRYKGKFKYLGKTYNLECDCKHDNVIFAYRNLHIEHEQQVIEISDMIKKGMLN